MNGFPDMKLTLKSRQIPGNLVRCSPHLYVQTQHFQHLEKAPFLVDFSCHNVQRTES